MSDCKHEWKLTMATDGCHFYQNTYYCELCRGSTSIGGERQFWLRGKMQPDIYSANPDCERCRELEAGARRKPTRRYELGTGLGIGWIRVKVKP